MITLKNSMQIEKMRVAGKMLYDVLGELRAAIRPGVTTLHLDSLAHKLITSMGEQPTFLGVKGLYTPYPYTLCCSVDDMIVHGFPNDQPLKEGQILSIDCGLMYLSLIHIYHRQDRRGSQGTAAPAGHAVRSSVI